MKFEKINKNSDEFIYNNKNDKIDNKIISKNTKKNSIENKKTNITVSIDIKILEMLNEYIQKNSHIKKSGLISNLIEDFLKKQK